MENFGKYLESKRIASKKRVPFYVAWVSEFFKFVDKKSTEEITPKEVERFLKYLTKKREEWRVTQAEKAIRIYQYYEAHKNRPLSIHNEGSNDQWKAVAEEEYITIGATFQYVMILLLDREDKRVGFTLISTI